SDLVVLMGYLHPVDRRGFDNFGARAHAAGVDGVLLVDLSAEEAPDVLPVLTAHQLDSICLVAPTTSEARMDRICANSLGYIYYVSFKGVTGADRINVDDLAAQVARVRRHTDLPIAVGFGVRTPAIAAAVAQVADAVIVGSALVQEIGRLAADRPAMLATVAATLGAMRGAMDESPNTGELGA